MPRLYPMNRRRLPGRPPYVVTALRRKYAELKGAGDAEGLAHVGATLRIFNPGEDLDAIPAVRPYKGEREHWSRTALDILRTSRQPIATPDLARLTLVACGADPGDRGRYMSALCGLHAVLKRLADDGILTVIDDRRPKRWALAEVGPGD